MALIEILGGLIAIGWWIHHHHEEDVHHREHCDLDDVRRRRDAACRDDETLYPGHIRHRVELIFEHVEEARCHRAPGIANDVTTPHGRACLSRSMPRGGRHPEPRHLEAVEIAFVDDRPGDADDAIYVVIRGEELDCHDHFEEAWRLVRGYHRDWLLDDLFIGHHAVQQAIREARSRGRSRPADDGSGGAVARRR